MIVPSISNCITFYHLVKSSYNTPIIMQKAPSKEIITEDDLNFVQDDNKNLGIFAMQDSKAEEFMNS